MGGIYNSLYSVLQTLSLNYITAGLNALVHLLVQKCRSAEEDKFEQITMDPTWRHEKQTHKCKVNIL